VAALLGCTPRGSGSTVPEPSPTKASGAGGPALVEGAAGSLAERIDAMRLLGLLDELASDALGGRYTLHPDIDRAAEAILARYREAGVAPGSPAGYRVDYEIVVGIDPGPGTALSLGAAAPLVDPAKLQPRPEGAAGEAEGPLVFVGYGIDGAPGISRTPFDELAGLPLEGAVAVVLEGAPRAPAGTSHRHFFGRPARDMGRKLVRLAEAGAVAVIVVDDAAALEPGGSGTAPPLPTERADAPMRSRVDIPVVQLHARVARARLRRGSHSLGWLQARIDRDGQPRSGALRPDRARVVVDARPRVVRAPNLVAMVPGTDLADEIVLVGAHFDHIGTAAPGHGRCHARADDQADAICNGADDNASGSALVAELAVATAAGPAPRRTVVFTHFSGEELGLLGSRALAERLDDVPPFAGRRVVAMLNIDMVGRLRERLTVSGVGSSAGWMPLLDEVGPHGMRVLYDRSLTQRSDHAPFYERGIPALFFFTGLHADYHAPGDEMVGIRPEGLLKVTGLVAALTERLAAGEAMPFTPARAEGDGLVRALPGEDEATIVKIVEPDGTVAR